jgi:hypothetical protein
MNQHIDIKFRSLRHSKEAWNCVKEILQNYSVSPAAGGLLMETMSDLAEGIDKYIKDFKEFEIVEGGKAEETELPCPDSPA